MLVPSLPHFLLAVPHASLWHTVSFAQVTTMKPAHNGQRDSLWTSNANNVKKRWLFPHSAAVNLTFQGWKTCKEPRPECPAPLISHFLYPTVAQMIGLVDCLVLLQELLSVFVFFKRTLGSWKMKNGVVPVADQLRPPSHTIIPFDFAPILVSSDWIHSTPLPPPHLAPNVIIKKR